MTDDTTLKVGEKSGGGRGQESEEKKRAEIETEKEVYPCMTRCKTCATKFTPLPNGHRGARQTMPP